VLSFIVVLVMAVIFVGCRSWLEGEPRTTYSENNRAEGPGTTWSVMVLYFLLIKFLDLRVNKRHQSMTVMEPLLDPRSSLVVENEVDVQLDDDEVHNSSQLAKQPYKLLVWFLEKYHDSLPATV
jgi:hypothetical protein